MIRQQDKTSSENKTVHSMNVKENMLNVLRDKDQMGWSVREDIAEDGGGKRSKEVR